MKKRFRNLNISFRKAAMITVTILVIPLFFSVFLFDAYAVAQQQKQLYHSRMGILDLYQSYWEDTLKIVEDYLSETIINSSYFSQMVYSNTKTESYIAALHFDDQNKALLRSREILGAFSVYSQPHDMYRVIYEDSYSHKDLMLLREYVVQAANETKSPFSCKALHFSDRSVLVFTYTYQQNVVAAMIDPSQIEYVDLHEGGAIFFAQEDGKLYASPAVFKEEISSISDKQEVIGQKDGRYWEITKVPLSNNLGFLCYASPMKDFWDQLSPIQYMLLCITIILLAFIPICLIVLRRLLLEPMSMFTSTMKAIQSGDTTIRVPQQSMLQEVNQISETVNIMLDTIQQQKIEFYEQQLTTQYVQLQYLHLQIRPHFFLNILNVVYSLAGEGKDNAIQELVLNFSDYLRSIFKDSSKLISLETEVCSIKSYVCLQQKLQAYPPELKLDIDAETSQCLVPALSLLTFVENSFKHSQNQRSSLEIRIKSRRFSGGEENYLNISILDNGGGFTPEQLEFLNQKNSLTDSNRHVGISNIRNRLFLLYGSKASLSFRNTTDGACVELFLPIEDATERGIQ